MRLLLIGFLFAHAAAAATSYANLGGTGDRTNWLFTYIGPLASEANGRNLVNASGATGLGSMGFAGCNGQNLLFDFGQPRVIDEAKWYQNTNNNTGGQWKWQGSADASAWTDIGSSFTMGGGTSPTTQTTLNGNTTAYRYYRLSGVSGFTNDTNNGFMVEFKIDAAPAASTPLYSNTFGSGDRTATVTVTQNTCLSVTLSNLMRANYTTGSGGIFNACTSAGTSSITFQFSSKQIVDEINLTTSGSIGAPFWQIQGSNNGSSFTNIGTPGAMTQVFTNEWRVSPTGGNTTGYLYYRMLWSSGTPSNVPELRTFTFRLAADTSVTSGPQHRVTSGQ